jgi:PASTA domain
MDSGGGGEHVIYSGYTTGNIAPYDESLTFSPNGKDILFISYGSNPAADYYLDAYEIAANGKGDPKELTPDTHDVYSAVWTPAVTTCTVPNLKHKTLAQAKKELKKAACSLGKVTGPKKHRSRRHIVSQSPKPNKDEPAGTRVDVKLT